jgi:prephenate dehydratase
VWLFRATSVLSHRAARHFAEDTFAEYETSLQACRSFSEVFERIESSNEFYGAIPLENSSMGTIDANLDLLWTKSAIIVHEVYVPVHHNLITIPNARLEDIREVYSHPAALDQCRLLFEKYPLMRPVSHWDTGASAILVKEKNDSTIAAIASKKACDEQQLNVLLPNIEDYVHNATRFGLIIKAENLVKHIPTPYKVSFALELPNEPGSLATVLTNFARCGVNLASCKSRPEPGQPWHYRFFVDIEVANEEQHERSMPIAENSNTTFACSVSIPSAAWLRSNNRYVPVNVACYETLWSYNFSAVRLQLIIKSQPREDKQ